MGSRRRRPAGLLARFSLLNSSQRRYAPFLSWAQPSPSWCAEYEFTIATARDDDDVDDSRPRARTGMTNWLQLASKVLVLSARARLNTAASWPEVCARSIAAKTAPSGGGRPLARHHISVGCVKNKHKRTRTHSIERPWLVQWRPVWAPSMPALFADCFFRSSFALALNAATGTQHGSIATIATAPHARSAPARPRNPSSCRGRIPSRRLAGVTQQQNEQHDLQLTTTTPMSNNTVT
jgi:hypothetical protein